MTAPRPRGVFLIALFFAVATLILLGVGFALLLPGTAMESVWLTYPARRAVLMPHRDWLGPGFFALAGAMAAASIGNFHKYWWGWWLAAAIFAVNGLADAAQIALGHWAEGAVGVLAAAAVLVYLTRPAVRAAYR